jgi:hypothetical protein
MKALTVRQPWASLIAASAKTIETRSQRTHHRGPLAIHAGLHRPVEGEDVGDWWWCWDVDQGVIVRQSKWAEHPAPLGAVVAVVEVVDCVPILHRDDDLAEAWMPHVAPNHQGHLWHWQGCNPEIGDPTWSVSDITDQLPYGDFTPGRWAWLLADARPLLVPISCRGAQGLWTVPDDIEAEVQAQLREAVDA